MSFVLIKSCLLAKLPVDGLLQQHSADHNAVAWLRDIAVKV